MEDYNNKTKAELLEIIQNLEKKVEQLSSESVSGRKERFRDRYSNRILDNLPDMLTVLDRDANIVELVSSPSTNHVEGTTADSITQSNIKDILPERCVQEHTQEYGASFPLRKERHRQA